MRLLPIRIFLALFCMATLVWLGWPLYRAEALRAGGEQAEATVLDAWGSGVSVSENPRVLVRLQVRPAGQPAYEVQTACLVSEANRIYFQPGIVVHVSFDPRNPSRVVYTPDICNEFGSTGLVLLASAIAATIAVVVWNGWPILDPRTVLRRRGVDAPATVLAAWDTTGRLKPNPVVQLRLQVHPPGQPAFEAQAQKVMCRQRLVGLRPGAQVDVKFDPKDLQTVEVLPFDGWRQPPA